MIVEATTHQRYCRHGHDTWVVGRYPSSNVCKECSRQSSRQRSEERNRRRREARKEKREGCYVPGLWSLRHSRGYTLRELAWESGLDHALLWRIEVFRQKATLEQRVAIFQAFNILRQRERDEEEAMRESERRRVWAGIG